MAVKHGGRGPGHLSRWPKAAASLTEQLLANLSGSDWGVFDLTDGGNVTEGTGGMTNIANSVTNGMADLTQDTEVNRPAYNASGWGEWTGGNVDWLDVTFDTAGAADTTVVLVLRTTDNSFALVGEDGGATGDDAGVVVDGSSNTSLLNGVDIEVDGTVYEAGTATPDEVHTDIADGNWRTVVLPSWDTSAMAVAVIGARGNGTLGFSGDIAWIGIVPDAQRGPATTVANAVRDGL